MVCLKLSVLEIVIKDFYFYFFRQGGQVSYSSAFAAFVKIAFSFTGGTVTRQQMGLPSNWSCCRQWIIGSSTKIPVSRPGVVVFSLKCKEIPKLKDYKVIPGQDFWDKFPYKNRGNTI